MTFHPSLAAALELVDREIDTVRLRFNQAYARGDGAAIDAESKRLVTARKARKDIITNLEGLQAFIDAQSGDQLS